MNEYKTIILGGGVSGLIASHFVKDSFLFEATDRVAMDFLDGLFPKYIHCSKIVEDLFSELNLKIHKEMFNIKILYKNVEYDFFNPLLNGAEKNFLYIDYCMKKYGRLKENKMNGFLSGKYERFFIKNKIEFIKKLYKENKKRILLHHKIVEIDLDSHQVHFENKKVIQYDNMITTIPIDVFSLISRKFIEVEEMRVNLICCSVKNRRHPFMKNDFAYVPDSNYTFHRVNVCQNKKYLVFELCDDLGCQFDVFSFLGKRKIPASNITERSFMFPVVKDINQIQNVKFLGRFATGDYETKIEDTIKEMQEYAK